jgi:hypothetical protein
MRGGIVTQDQHDSTAALDVSLTFADDDALRAHLDALNEAGVTPVAVGYDAHQAFLITLVGPYAESEDVLFDSPWQGDVDYGERIDGVWKPLPPRCDECMAHVHGMEHLRFPVTVMAPTLTTAERDRYDESLRERATDE